MNAFKGKLFKMHVVFAFYYLLAFLLGCTHSPEYKIMKEREAISFAIKVHKIDADSVLSKASAYMESGYITLADIIIGDLIWYYKNPKDSLSIMKAYELRNEINKIRGNVFNNNSKTNISKSTTDNKYYVNRDVIFAATTENNFDILMNCVQSGDRVAAGRMVDNGQVIYLYKNDIVYLVKPKFKCYIVRPEGSTNNYYVVGENLTKY
jgi:hypothetical protein